MDSLGNTPSRGEASGFQVSRCLSGVPGDLKLLGINDWTRTSGAFDAAIDFDRQGPG